MGFRILSVASEWFSYHGGLSSFNRSFCAALAAAGHEVVCLVPKASPEEINHAEKAGVKVEFPHPISGLGTEALLCLPTTNSFQPDIVIGHGHITGAVAAARVRHIHPEARRIHFLHTLPDEIEPFKDRKGEDPSQRAQRKQDTETELSITASLAVAVGPRLHRHWNTHIGGVRRGAKVHRLTPGLSDLELVDPIPQANYCLLMGRLEDAELKGVNLTAAAFGLINKDKYFRGQREITLVLRGAGPGTSNDLRAHVNACAQSNILCTIREYTHREHQIREDIARSSIVLMPSQAEGFGLVGIEALAMGVPILISHRSGLGELLMELIDADSQLEFARKYIVDVGDGIDKDAERWAEAIRDTLKNRERAYQETAILREVILKADYWHRAVAELFGALETPASGSKTPPFVPPDVPESGRKIAENDIATRIVSASGLLEREIERVSVVNSIAVPALPAAKYLELLSESGLLDAIDAASVRKVLHLRNMAAHKFDTMFTAAMAEEHLQRVQELVQKLKLKYPSESPLDGDVPADAQSTSTVTDANAEIDVAAARLKAGEPDIAIHILEEIRKKRWDKLSPRERYRTAANIGHALERKGELAKSAKYYLEAKEHQPLDEKARAMEAIAYYHLGQIERAYELAGDVIRDHPNSTVAIAVRIRSAPPDMPLGALEAIVPAALGGEFDILHALVWKAIASGDTASANRIMDTALKHHPNADEAREQQAIVIVHDEGKAKHANRHINSGRLELAIGTLSAAITKHRGQRHEAHLRYTRAEALDILGKTEEAAADFRSACDVDNDNPDLVRRFVLFLKRHDRSDAAIDLLQQADKVKKDHRNRLLLAGLLSDRKAEGDIEIAIRVLQETIVEKPDPDIRSEAVALLTHLTGDQNRHGEAISYLDGLAQGFLKPSVFNAIRSRALLRAGRKEEATVCALRGAEALATDSSITDRMRVAESLSFVDMKQEALKQWKAILKPDHVDDFVRMALSLARETGDDEFIMSFCKQLRAAGVMTPFTLELEVVTLEKYRIYDRVIDVMNSYLAASPDGELAKVFRLRLTLLGIQLEKSELVESDPAKLPPVESSPVRMAAATANALRHGPHPERGIEYAYELVRRHFNDHIARGVYVATVGLGDDEYHFSETSAAGPGCAVKFKPDDSIDEKWIIIEDAVNPDQAREEYGPNHIWVKELTGQNAGGRFHLRRDEMQPRLATITAIVSKYVYRKFEIIDGWEDRFPDEDKFFVRKYTMPTKPDGSPDVSPILKALDLREKQIEEMHALYRASPISATTFAIVSGSGLLEALNHLASEGTLPIRCCLGSDVELARAQGSLSGTEPLVLDPTALATLFFSNQYEQLQLMPGKVVLCESALDEYVEMRRKFSNTSRGFMGKFKGKYLFRKDDPTEREQQEQRLDAFLTKIKSLVTMKTGESFAKLAPEAREELIGLFGEPTAQAMAEAAATGAVLWTDDLGVAEFGRERTGITKRVWSQIVFQRYAPPEVATEFTLFLIQWHYFFTRLEPDVVLAACRDGAWSPDAPVLKLVAEWLGQPELIHEGAIRMCFLTLPLVWKHGPDLQKKQSVAKLFLQALRRRKEGRSAISIIQGNLTAVFGDDIASRGECGSVIDEMIQAERTPGEIATSKAMWGKAAKIIQRKTGMQGTPGSQSNGQTKHAGYPKQHRKPKKDDRKRKKR